MSTAPIFFSYSRNDSEFVLQLASDVRAAGGDLWLDQLDIAAGSQWDVEVQNALKRADFLIVVLSPTSVASQNVMDEVSYAIDEGKHVVPVVIADCEIPFRLRRIQHIDFRSKYDEACKTLMHVLNDKPVLGSDSSSQTGQRPDMHQGNATRSGANKFKAIVLVLLVAAVVGGVFYQQGLLPFSLDGTDKRQPDSDQKLVSVPDVLGQPVSLARDAFSNAGLAAKVTYQEAICYPAGLVIEQDEGKLPKGKEASIVVSKMRRIEGSLVGFRYGRNVLLDLKPRVYGNMTGIYYRWLEITLNERKLSSVEFKNPFADGVVTRITDSSGRTLSIPTDGGLIQQATLGAKLEPYATAHRMVGVYKHVTKPYGYEFAIFSDEGTLCECDELWSPHPLRTDQVTITFVHTRPSLVSVYLHPMGETEGSIIVLNEETSQIQMTVPVKSRWCIRSGPFSNSEELTSVVAAQDGQVLIVADIGFATS